MGSGLFKNVIFKICLEIIYYIYIYIYIIKKDLALNNLQWLICHKTKLNHIKYYMHKLYIIEYKKYNISLTIRLI